MASMARESCEECALSKLISSGFGDKAFIFLTRYGNSPIILDDNATRSFAYAGSFKVSIGTTGASLRSPFR